MNDFRLVALKKRIGTVRTSITDSELLFLIARRKAAEKVCQASSEVVRPKERQSLKNAPREMKIFGALEAWRKASRKSE